jgi:hypothetical protein
MIPIVRTAIIALILAAIAFAAPTTTLARIKKPGSTILLQMWLPVPRRGKRVALGQRCDLYLLQLFSRCGTALGLQNK